MQLSIHLLLCVLNRRSQLSVRMLDVHMQLTIHLQLSIRMLEIHLQLTIHLQLSIRVLNASLVGELHSSASRILLLVAGSDS